MLVCVGHYLLYPVTTQYVDIVMCDSVAVKPTTCVVTVLNFCYIYNCGVYLRKVMANQLRTHLRVTMSMWFTCVMFT